jgi:hypothetical protein
MLLFHEYRLYRDITQNIYTSFSEHMRWENKNIDIYATIMRLYFIE